MLFGEKILEYWDDIIKDLKTLIAIPSVSIKGDDKHPFGDECAKAIDCVMDMCKDYDISAKNVDYYAMHAEIGKGEENAVVMAHIDVVPVSDGWDTNPFKLTEKNGKLYGRGTVDDKACAVVALHCLRALNDAKIESKRKLRVVLGASEETGMADMDYYFAHEQHPTMGFTPDGGYGICNCEKGNIDFSVSHNNDSKILKSFTAGTVINAVPSVAECSISCSEDEMNQLIVIAEKSEGKFVVNGTNDNLTIKANGTAAHASMPELGLNAISLLVELLYSIFEDKIGTLLSFIHDKIGMNYDGEPIGVKMSDEESGALTFNLGILKADSKTVKADIDIRFPATKKTQEIIDVLKLQAENSSVNFDLISTAEPLYLPKDSKIVKLLSSAYTDVTKTPCTIYSMGGGTYAKKMQGVGVAFGPVFEENVNESAHMANEYIDIEDLKRHAKICLEAMYRMLVAE